MIGCFNESSINISAAAQLLPLVDYADRRRGTAAGRGHCRRRAHRPRPRHSAAGGWMRRGVKGLIALGGTGILPVRRLEHWRDASATRATVHFIPRPFRIQWAYVLERRLAIALSLRLARDRARRASLSLPGRRHRADAAVGPRQSDLVVLLARIVPALRGRYRLVVPDHIGCGLSDKPAAGAYSYRLAQRVADLGN